MLPDFHELENEEEGNRWIKETAPHPTASVKGNEVQAPAGQLVMRSL